SASGGGRAKRDNGALLHRDATTGRAQSRVLPDAADGAEPTAEHDRMARRALRPAQLRQAPRVRIPQGQACLRAVSDRGSDQSEYRDFAAALALEPDGLAGDPRPHNRDPDRELDSLCIAALPAGGAGTTARAQTRDRGLWRPGRDEGDACRSIGGAVQG